MYPPSIVSYTNLNVSSLRSFNGCMYCISNTTTWDDYLIDIGGSFGKSYLVDLEDTIEDIHILFNVISYRVSSSFDDVMMPYLEPLVPSLHYNFP